jgi:thioredoxin 2
MIVLCPACSQQNRVPAARLLDRAKCGGCKGPLGPVAKPIAIDSAASFDELLAGAKSPVVVDFWAAWCGPCRSVAPEVEKLARSRQGHVIVAKVDTEALPAIAGRYGIRSIPTFVAFRGGVEAARTSGAMGEADLARELHL